MDTSPSDLAAIRQLLADLTTRVYRIERRLQMEAPSAEPRPPAIGSTSPPPTPSQTPSALVSDKAPPAVPPPQYVAPGHSPVLRAQPDADLESRIGSHWL